MKDSLPAWIGSIVAVIVGWDKIVTFIQSVFIGIGAFVDSLPPIILLALLIGLFWFMANRK